MQAHPPVVDSQYSFPGKRSMLLARTWPSGVFYTRVAWTVLRAARLAKAGVYSNERYVNSCREIWRTVEAMGTPLSIEGIEHFRQLGNQPCLFIGNHMSTLETFLLGGIVLPWRPMTFVVKRQLVEYPIFKHIMISRNPVVVGRDNPREDLKAVLEGGQERLQNGTSITVFPQTTRSEAFDPEQFNTIGVKLAKRAGVPVIPLALKTNAWANGSWHKDFGPYHPQKPVRFAFGEPLEVTDNGKQAHAAIIAFIQMHLERWNQTDASTL